MTIYVFETMTQGDAASFTALDTLTFAAQTATATQVAVSPYSNNQGGSLGNSGINLTYSGKTLVFPTDLATASETTSTNGGIQFRDGSHLIIGTGNGDTGATGSGTNALVAPTVANPATAPASVVYGLGGSDTITGNNGNNYLYGGSDGTSSGNLSSATMYGVGGDSITAGNGNNHIYGNALTTQQGDTDGNDRIVAGSGTNYINGNAGNDLITVGAANSTGANRVLGGSGNDSITVTGQGANRVNGNLGNDVITAAGSTGNNELHGGNNDDMVTGGAGQTRFYGDIGNDTLVSGAGTTTTLADGSTMTAKLSIMTGGTGNDTFDFSGTDAGYAGTTTGNANNVHSGITIGGQTYFQTITDFTQGQDTIHLSFSGMSSGSTPTAQYTDIVRAQSGVTFTSVSAAETYAQQLLNNHALSTNNGSGSTTAAGEVAAIDVNGSTYLFFNHTGTGTIDSIVQLTGVSSSTLSQAGTGIHTFG